MTMTIPILVGVIVAVNQLLKNAGVPTKAIPLISMVLGIATGVFFLPGATIQETVFNGIAIGLGSNGLFDLAKSAVSVPTAKVVDDGQAASVEVKDEAVNKMIGFK